MAWTRGKLLIINQTKRLDFLWTAIDSPEEYEKKKSHIVRIDKKKE